MKKVAEHNPSEKTPPNDPWTTIYSALIPKGASPPDEYHGDILYWIPGMEYETIVNVDGTRESKIVLPDHKEKNDRVHKALGKLKVEYAAQGKSASDEEARQISIEIWTDGFSALNAAKFLGAGGGALDGKYAIEFAQKALDENPNDFHTLYLWSILHDFNGGPFYNRELEDKAESGYRRLLEMNPNSVPVLHSLGYHLYIERDIKEDPKQSIAESIVLLQKSVQLDPTYLKGSSLYRLAKSYYAVRDTAKAIETLKRLNSLFPSERI